MSGCLNRCPEIDNVDLYNAWASLRDNYGPRPESMTPTYRNSLYTTDLTDFISWANDHGQDPADPNLFGKFMNWKLSVGTNAFGNLPQRVREYVGISCVPCPYDTASSADRSEIWLGAPVSTQVSHGIYRMKISQHGSKWGFVCTFSGCPFEIDNGRPYFHA